MNNPSELRNPYAELSYPDSGDLISPAQATSATKLFCPHVNCLDPERRLFLKESKNGRPFFSHFQDCEHPGNYETLLHKLTVRYFKDLKEFTLPDLNCVKEVIQIRTASTEIEYNGIREIKPDVRIFSESGDEFLIEILVTHATKGKKVEIIRTYNKPAIEIDLSHFYESNGDASKYDVAFVKSKVPDLISDNKLKSWLYHPKIVQSENGAEIMSEGKPLDQKTGLSLGEKAVVGAGLFAILLAVSPWLRRNVVRLVKGLTKTKNPKHRN